MTGSQGEADTAYWALVVDDDGGVRQSLRLCLEAAGIGVVGVGSGPAALEALGRRRFALVFLDLWLGAESGLELLPQLRRLQPGLSVVVITAYATDETAAEAQRLGATGYLAKPFTPDQVRAAARQLLPDAGSL